MSDSNAVTADTARASVPAKPVGIDPRGPRFVAAVTGVVLLVVVFLGLVGSWLPALILLAAQFLVFAWSAIAGVRKHPYAVLFRRVIRPRLNPPPELEDPRPPTFAQLVGAIITGLGVVLGLLGPAYALVIVVAAAFAFVAAFLNAVFAFCLGCEIYLVLVRVGIIRPKTPLLA